MKINDSIIPEVYKISKKFYEGGLTLKAGIKQLSDNFKMNPGAAQIYMYTFRYMMNGEKFTRTLNAYSFDYFLRNIYEDFGQKGLAKAMNALNKHIYYYENERKQKVIMHNIRDIYNKYSTLISSKPYQNENRQAQVSGQEIKTDEKTDAFKEFLINKNAESKEKIIDWELRKNEWLKSIDEFYDLIKNWLSPFQREGLIEINLKDIDLNEEYIGHYKTQSLQIQLGKDIIYLTPRGTLVVGVNGRIDMRGPKGEVYLVEPEWNNWKFAKRNPLSPWQPKIDDTNITEESFKGAIQEMVNG